MREERRRGEGRERGVRRSREGAVLPRVAIFGDAQVVPRSFHCVCTRRQCRQLCGFTFCHPSDDALSPPLSSYCCKAD